MAREPVEDAVKGIRSVLPRCNQLVSEFLNSPDDYGAGFAGPTFDLLQPNDPNAWHSSDLVAVGLLDVKVPPSGVRAMLLEQAATFNSALAAVDPDVPLWADDDEQVEAALVHAAELSRLLAGITGVGRTTSSKLLARKRPNLVPINDSVIRRLLGVQPSDDFPRLLRAALRTDGIMALIRDARPSEFSGLSELRILDIALWMAGSRSRSAQRARATFRIEGPSAIGAAPQVSNFGVLTDE